MQSIVRAIMTWGRTTVSAWNDFWFTPTDLATLSLLRVLVGGMLFYTHLVWSFGLNDFFGADAWVPIKLLKLLPEAENGYTWTWFQWIHAPWLLWTAHLAALLVLLMLTLGLFSRTTAVLSYLIAVSYLHRVSLAEFGLDRINVMLAMYLMLGPCGGRYSLDQLWRRRSGSATDDVSSSTSANLAIRLIQIHMCVIYFFAGIRKLGGFSWWTGDAMWFSVANLEYQTLDMTWLAAYPLLTTAMTNLTAFFEVAYAALIWPRLTRPVMLLLAVFLHLGIVVALGMPTFGAVMLIGNVAFLSPELVRSLLERSYRIRQRAAEA